MYDHDYMISCPPVDIGQTNVVAKCIDCKTLPEDSKTSRRKRGLLALTLSGIEAMRNKRGADGRVSYNGRSHE